MTLRHMKIFVTVFQQGSITGAARKLHLAQPSVSLAVKELENYYGLRLFERIGRHISPTEGGKNFTVTPYTSFRYFRKWSRK